MELEEVRIPGKVMLSGEYAVLHGGTAVLMPVQRTLAVREDSPDPATPVSPVLKEALAEPIDEIASWEEKHPLKQVRVDRSEFVIEGVDGAPVKLGLGSSAAEAVGVIALRMQRAGLDWTGQRPRVAELAERAHRRAQGGVGSGADVAVSAWGCPIRFHREGDTFAVQPIAVPDDAAFPPMQLAWTGTPANTRELVAIFEAWASSGPLAQARLNHLLEHSDRLADAWFTRPAEELLVEFDDFCDAMQACARAAGLPWKLPVHDNLARWAKEHGGRAKPTGAGGGDLALLVGDLPLEERSEPLLPLYP